MVMNALKARVQNGRLVMDVPTEFPEGTEFDLVIADEDDELDPDERAALDASLEKGRQQAEAGRTLSAREVLEELKARR
ncbi:MAG: hypothetical protein HY906_15530 [Deltaproteobacteria bacterium]|nr:hypothetical protein [Deltaproteobacteria bacterium]